MNRRGALRSAGVWAALTGIAGIARAQGAGSGAPRIRTLAFDSYGSLFDVESLDALCEQLYPGQGKALSTLWRSKQLQYSQMRSMMRRYRDFFGVTNDALVHAAASLKLTLDEDRRRQLVDAYLTLPVYPDVAPAMKALKAQGIRLYLLSNGTRKMLSDVAKNSGLDVYLDGLMSVDDIKVFKPDPGVYRMAINRLHLAPRALGFVSSHSWDINGAASFGLTTFWVPRHERDAADELGQRATHTLASMSELAPLLRA